MPHRNRLSLAGLLLAFLSSCTFSPRPPLPTPIPAEYLPTAIALTVAALSTPVTPTQTEPASATFTSTPEPSLTSSPTLTIEPTQTSTPSATPTVLLLPTLPPTLTPTPTATPKLSTAAIQILSPGPMSKLVSSIHLSAYVMPGAGNKITVELLGEDGRLLGRKILQYTVVSSWVYVGMEIPFEIRAVAETARLQISTRDEEGRLIALSSVRLVLLSEGFAEITPSGPLDERCILRQPTSQAAVSGGTLTVDGSLRPFNSNPLEIELVTEEGRIIGLGSAVIQPAADGGYVSFAASIAYSVSAPTWVRLSLHQKDDKIPGTVYLYSRQILLNP